MKAMFEAFEFPTIRTMPYFTCQSTQDRMEQLESTSQFTLLDSERKEKEDLLNDATMVVIESENNDYPDPIATVTFEDKFGSRTKVMYK